MASDRLTVDQTLAKLKELEQQQAEQKRQAKELEDRKPLDKKKEELIDAAKKGDYKTAAALMTSIKTIHGGYDREWRTLAINEANKMAIQRNQLEFIKNTELVGNRREFPSVTPEIWVAAEEGRAEIYHYLASKFSRWLSSRTNMLSQALKHALKCPYPNEEIVTSLMRNRESDFRANVSTWVPKSTPETIPDEKLRYCLDTDYKLDELSTIVQYHEEVALFKILMCNISFLLSRHFLEDFKKYTGRDIETTISQIYKIFMKLNRHRNVYLENFPDPTTQLYFSLIVDWKAWRILALQEPDKVTTFVKMAQTLNSMVVADAKLMNDLNPSILTEMTQYYDQNRGTLHAWARDGLPLLNGEDTPLVLCDVVRTLDWKKGEEPPLASYQRALLSPIFKIEHNPEWDALIKKEEEKRKAEAQKKADAQQKAEEKKKADHEAEMKKQAPSAPPQAAMPANENNPLPAAAPMPDINPAAPPARNPIVKAAENVEADQIEGIPAQKAKQQASSAPPRAAIPANSPLAVSVPVIPAASPDDSAASSKAEQQSLPPVLTEQSAAEGEIEGAPAIVSVAVPLSRDLSVSNNTNHDQQAPNAAPHVSEPPVSYAPPGKLGPVEDPTFFRQAAVASTHAVALHAMRETNDSVICKVFSCDRVVHPNENELLLYIDRGYTELFAGNILLGRCYLHAALTKLERLYSLNLQRSGELKMRIQEGLSLFKQEKNATESQSPAISVVPRCNSLGNSGNR